MVERGLAVLGLAGAILVALALTGALQHPAIPGAGAAQYCPTDQYGTQYGDCTDDTIAPLIGTVVTPGPNDNGWNNTNVTLVFNATDDVGGTGVRSITCNLGGTTNGSTRGIVFTAATVNTVVTCTAMDWAGNVSDPASKHIQIDKVRPSIGLGTRSPAPDLYGWNYTDVTVTWPCSDAFSGAVTPAVSRTVTTNGQSQSVTGTCIDLAGNQASASLFGINIDKNVTTPTGGPPNDNIALATIVPSLPFSDSVDTTTATRETHEPVSCGQPDDHTLWYRFSAGATSSFVRVSEAGTLPTAPVISVWQPTTTGLSPVNCFFSGTGVFRTQPNGTYYIKVGSAGPGAGPFTVGIAAVPPPPNDNFENAKEITSLPFSDPLDLTAASVQAGEPLRPGGPLTAPLMSSAWYRFTPQDDMQLIFGGTTTSFFGKFLTVYTGSTLTGLAQVAFNNNIGLFPAAGTSYFFPVVFHAVAGTTYYLQIGSQFPPPSGDGGITVGLDQAIRYLGQQPPPNANGWNNTPVVLSWSCSPLLPFAFPPTQALGADGRNQSATGVCSSPFGVSASDTERGINIDQTPPATTFQGQSPPANANATGTLLSLHSEPGDSIGQGKDQVYTGADSVFTASLPPGGDTFSAHVFQFSQFHFWNVTLAAPQGEPLAVGHYADAQRAVFRPPGIPALDISGDGRGCNMLSGSFDITQLTRAPDGSLLTLDATFEQHCEFAGPALFGRIRYDASNLSGLVALGWNSGDVTLTWSCADTLSGVTTPSDSRTLTDEGAGQSATGTCSDLAGNSSSDTEAGIGIDKTLPNAVPAADRAPEYSGSGDWFEGAVTVGFGGSGDPNGANGTAGSGLDPGSLPPPVTFTAQGSHSVTGTVKDLAGNESALASLTVHVDTDAPDLTVTFATADGSSYTPGSWTNQAVTATFHCTDTGGSGVASSSTPQTVLTEGANQFVVGNCTDNVGHTTTQTFGGIDIDLTPPEAYLVFDPTSRDVQLFGRDQGGSGLATANPVAPTTTTGPGAQQTRTYTVLDGAGNRLVVVLQAKPGSGLLQVSFSSLRYNAAPAATAPFTSLTYDWATNKDGSLKSLDQDLTIGKGPTQRQVLASYDASKNQTKITDSSGSSTRTGLVLVLVATNGAALSFEY